MPAGLSNAISGLDNFQRLIDIVGNNIANLNTPGYKSSNVSFKEIMSQTLKGAAAPNSGSGGTNPMQLGLGTTVGTVECCQSQGPVEVTGKDTDMAITGNGYFFLKDGTSVRYSRSGNFSIDSNGDLVSPTGMKVQGWTTKNADGSIDIAGGQSALTAINIPLGQSVSAKATTQMTFTGNFNAAAPLQNTAPPATLAADYPTGLPTPSYITKVTTYDAMGSATELTIVMNKVTPALGTTPAQWDYWAYGPPDATGVRTRLASTPAATPGVLCYDNQGKYAVTASTNVAHFIYTPANGAAAVDATPDYSLTTQLETDISTVVARNQDGAKAGSLETFTIDSNGLIVGNYTNGNAANLGQVALVSFTNPVGLNKVENGLYIASANSGIAIVGSANSGSRGAINGSSLEGSNVDLGTEFTKMIIAQRAFQANSRVVTAYSEILQEVANLGK